MSTAISLVFSLALYPSWLTPTTEHTEHTENGKYFPCIPCVTWCVFCGCPYRIRSTASFIILLIIVPKIIREMKLSEALNESCTWVKPRQWQIKLNRHPNTPANNPTTTITMISHKNISKTHSENLLNPASIISPHPGVAGGSMWPPATQVLAPEY